VCSNTGDAIDRIVAAIDQLASDAHDLGDKASEDELTARVAALWQMVSDLDPELARRAQRYTVTSRRRALGLWARRRLVTVDTAAFLWKTFPCGKGCGKQPEGCGLRAVDTN
jgi:hypothetical protein